jgi:hypothetical protein
MTVRTRTVYTCDFCRYDLASDALPGDWLEVQTPWPAGQIPKHLCSGCRERIAEREAARGEG